jgi:alpha-tubulin suppressor-like RCC1 family protein
MTTSRTALALVFALSAATFALIACGDDAATNGSTQDAGAPDATANDGASTTDGASSSDSGTGDAGSSSEGGADAGFDGSPLPAQRMVAGGYHTCAFKADGSLWCWGHDATGSLGSADSGSNSSTPLSGTGINDGVTLALFYFTTCVVRPTGEIDCFGQNATNQLGTPAAGGPTPVTAMAANPLQVTGGSYHACILQQDHSVGCWGENYEHELAQLDAGGSYAPVPIPGVTNVTRLSRAGGDSYHTCAISNGTVMCWGDNTHQQLGHPDASVDFFGPVTVPGLTDAVDVSVGQYHSCAIKNGGSVVCWGSNTESELGSDGGTSATPVAVAGIDDAIGLSAGLAFTCALRANGAVACWGSNAYGQLGANDGTPSATPLQVSGIANAVDVTCGSEFACARLSNGKIMCWGNNGNGQLGAPTLDASTSPMPVEVSGF